MRLQERSTSELRDSERIIFYAVAEHHALAIRPIYLKMREMGKDVVPLFNQPPKKLLPYSRIVSSTAPDVPPEKRKDTIYHFHSLAPYHVNPAETDYKYIPLFKGVIFPGKWWVDKWKKLPELWAVAGWPKNDSLKPSTQHEKTVLYASSMLDFSRMRTLQLLLKLSNEMVFKLMVKPHHGTAMWYPKQLKAMGKLTEVVDSTIDVADLFHEADILISESSGALWEFMATGKPSIQMVQAEKWGRRFPGGVCKADFNSLGKVIERCFDNPDLCGASEWSRKVMGEVDGKATLRAIRFIEEVFNE